MSLKTTLNVSVVSTVLRHAPLHKQRCHSDQSVQSTWPAAPSWHDSEYMSASSLLFQLLSHVNLHQTCEDPTTALGALSEE